MKHVSTVAEGGVDARMWTGGGGKREEHVFHQTENHRFGGTSPAVGEFKNTEMTVKGIELTLDIVNN